MADTLLIYFDPKRAEQATWSLVNAAGELSTMLSYGSLSDAAPLAQKHPTVVLLDSTSVHIDAIDLPIKNAQKLLRAAPFALEDKIADDVEEMHFVIGKTTSDGRTPVAAIRRSTLEETLALLETAGIRANAIIPDALCLTANDQQWAILLQDDQAIIQFNSYDAGKLDRELVPLILQTELQSKNRQLPEKIILFTADNDSAETEDIEQAVTDEIELIRVSYNQHPLVINCGQYKQAAALNLLQGKYKPQSKTSVNWQRWRLSAVMALLFICLQLGITATQFHGLQEQNQKIQVEIDKIYKQAFPESKRIVNARVQMEQKLNELKGMGGATGNTSFITLLADASTALAADKTISIQSINFRNNKIDLEVNSSTLRSIELLNKKLNSTSLKAEIISSSSEKNRVKGNIRIQRPTNS